MAREIPRRLVKVQMPIDMARATLEGTMWVDMKNPNVLIYAKGGQWWWQGEYPELRKAMLEVDNGPGQPKGLVKAYWFGTYDKATQEWRIDFKAGLQPLPTEEW